MLCLHSVPVHAACDAAVMRCGGCCGPDRPCWGPHLPHTCQPAATCLPPTQTPCLPQVCLLDLDYGLPVQVRDQALGQAQESLPESDAGKEYALNRMQVRGVVAGLGMGRCGCRGPGCRGCAERGVAAAAVVG